ncbi:hypothetical protein [Microbulbifer sp. TYP-18]|uniref:hypothetical protein n=1 Tax=Microbulbifer sp. TYP-18 TaxID=3230024 RepID=UPI0034C694A8
MSYRTGPGVPRSLAELWQFIRREFMSIERLYTRVEKETKDAQGDADDARTRADNAAQAAATAKTDAEEALEDLDNIAADGQLHPAEKLTANREYNEIIAEQSGIEIQAETLGISTEKVNYSSAISALTSYLQGLTPTWNATNSTTSIGRSTWNGKWQEVYSRRQILLNKISAILESLINDAQADVDAALEDLSSIAADGILHQNEKLLVIREYAQLFSEQPGIAAQADRAGITTEKSSYAGSLNTLDLYLDTLSPAWNDTDAATPINRILWNLNWQEVYGARQALLNAIAQQARDSGVTGAALQFKWDGRPLGLAWPQSTNYAGGTKFTFNASVGRGYIHVLANDAEGGARVGFNGAQVGVMSGQDGVSQWYSFPVTLQTGVNEISVWASSGDGGTYGGIVVTLGGSGDPEALLDASAADAKAAAARDAADGAKADAETALADLGDIAADSKLHPAEKPQVIREYSQLLAEQAGNEAEANRYNITTEKTAYSGAITALSDYLSGTGWDNTASVTSINRSTWDTKWRAVYTARQTLLNKIDQIAGSLADWGKVYGPGKPEDGATVGATAQEWAQIRTMRHTVLEDFSDPVWMGAWEVPIGDASMLADYTAAGGSANVKVGGSAALLGKAESDGGVYMYSGTKVPFDPEKLYRVECRVFVYNEGDLSRLLYLGVAGFDKLGNLCNTNGAETISGQHYLTAAGVTASAHGPDSWKKYVSYFKGNATGNYVAGSGIGSPAQLQRDVRYFSPLILANYSEKPGRTIVDYFKIDVVEIQDQRNLPLIQSGIASLPTSSALSAVDAGSTARINIAAHNVQFDFGLVSYNAGSISGLSFSRKYYVYCDDPGTKGGAVTYKATRNFHTLAAHTWRRQVGTITTPANGGGSTTPPDPWCVAAGMWLRDDLKAEHCSVDDLIDCWDTRQPDIHKGAIQAVKPQDDVPCVQLTTSSGAKIICSRETPVTDREGVVYEAQNARGVLLGVLHNDDPLAWETVTHVQCAGLRTVYKISVGGISYAAGIDPQHRVITHNQPHKP